jgi:hypothetical protein
MSCCVRLSGYVAAPRAIAIPNASLFDRILVLPPSVAPVPTSAAPVAASVSVAPTARRPGAGAPGVASPPSLDGAGLSG